MLFSAALCRADVIARGSISSPTEKAAPNYISNQNVNDINTIFEKIIVSSQAFVDFLVQ